MAITATFKADFQDFFKAVEKAEDVLVDLSKGANKVDASLKRMVDGFSGRKLVQEATLTAAAVEAIGGTSKLTIVALPPSGLAASTIPFDSTPIRGLGLRFASRTTRRPTSDSGA